MKYLIINGAGASKDISKNFPDGKGLLEKLKNNYDTNNIIKNHNPSSIDHLMTTIIDQNKYPDLVNKVKNGIFRIIHETQDKILKWNDNYFFDIIQNKILIDNVDQIDVINFNYDTALESIVEYFINLYKSQNDASEKGQTRIEKLKNFKIRLQNSHVYGYIDNDGRNIDFIRITTQERKAEFIKKIKDAENIYFLGFGFDQTNLQNLGLFDQELKNHLISSLHNQKSKKIFITNYVGGIEQQTSGGGRSQSQTTFTIDDRKFSNKIMLIIGEIFGCTIQTPRNGFFSQGFLHNGSNSSNPIDLYVSGLSVGNAVSEDFTF